MKLSAKFARQETEEVRIARIARRRVSNETAGIIRRMLDVSEVDSVPSRAATVRSGALVCSDCGRQFSHPMHLGRHSNAKHRTSSAGR